MSTMFEIADLYVSSLEASEYASFLRDLLFSIVDADGGLPVRKRTSAARESAYDTRKDQPGHANLDMIEKWTLDHEQKKPS